MTTNEEIKRIETSSDLKFPENAKVNNEKDTEKKEETGFSFKNSILGGLASGGVFFGLDKFIRWGTKVVNEEIEDEDQEIIEEDND